MTTKHKLANISDDFPISRMADEGPPAPRRREPCFRFLPRYLRAVIATGIVLALPQLIFAQESGQTQAPHTTVVAKAQPNAARLELPEAPRSSSDAGTASSTAAAPVSSATATITGTVLDVNGDLIPGATVVLKDASSDDIREITADDSAAFKFDSVKTGISYEVNVQVKGFSEWTSPAIVLAPSQFMILDTIHLKMEGESTSITVHGSTEDIAVEQVHLQEQQRVLGFIPNFYVAYDSANAVPMTTKLKFKLAMRVATDPITIIGVGFMAGVNQAANRPDYVQGWKGYGQRFGAEAAAGFQRHPARGRGAAVAIAPGSPLFLPGHRGNGFPAQARHGIPFHL